MSDDGPRRQAALDDIVRALVDLEARSNRNWRLQVREEMQCAAFHHVFKEKDFRTGSCSSGSSSSITPKLMKAARVKENLTSHTHSMVTDSMAHPYVYVTRACRRAWRQRSLLSTRHSHPM
jgi:hypothetical protein